MFWRFGFANASSIDSLLDREDVSLEAILDEDDLLQECKSQNNRLIDYFSRVDVLQRLFGYVTGQIESEEKGRFKYPYVATEVLCSEIWSIVDTCITSQTQLLVPFWETVLDRPPDDMKTQMVMASHFAKITSAFLSKKPAEMLAFIEAQPSIVERLICHIETPAFPEILSRLIELDDRPEGAGVLEWLSSQNFIGRLLDLLSPEHANDVHTIVSDLLKNIISLANPSPGAGLTDGLQNGPSSNRFARELASRKSIEKLVSYMLYEFSSENPATNEGTDISSGEQTPPTPETCASSVTNSISVLVELIRKHNSDYFEPYLFHTLRNRLIHVQQHMHMQSDDGRDFLEQAMKDMVDRMGVVHLGPLLEVISARLDEFQKFLRHPRSLSGPISTTVGQIQPLTFERYRICELFAELLHCSNMALLNRPSAYSRLYDSEGRLQGGLSALEELANVIALNTNNDRDRENMTDSPGEIEPALELPISHAHQATMVDSDDDMSDGEEPGSSDDEAMEEIAMFDEPGSSLELSPIPVHASLPPPSSSPSNTSLSPDSPKQIGAGSNSPSLTSSVLGGHSSESPVPPRSPARSFASRRSSRKVNAMESSTDGLVPIGEQLKRRFLDLNIFSTVLDLFFDFPWNNFLHSAVYDIIHQVLTGDVNGGLNRELAISVFRDAKMMHRIVDGQRRNDAEIAKPKGVRLGYMGHLTLMSEDVITALERFPPDLRLIIHQYAPEPEWDQYVTGRYDETKKRDTHLLGGGKPVVNVQKDKQRWVDEEEASSSSSGIRGEFRRANSVGPSREISGGADFGPAPMEDSDDEYEEDDNAKSAPQFARYLAQEMHSSDHFGSSSDDDDDDEGWLTQSNFSLHNPPVTSRRHGSERRPLSTFDDSFGSNSSTLTITDDPFNSHDDDGFGPFSDLAAVDGDDPFTIPSSHSAIPDDMFDDNFGDFGEFQAAEGEGHFHSIDSDFHSSVDSDFRSVDSDFHSADSDFHDGDHDGELTPTTGSWTLAEGSASLHETIAEDFGGGKAGREGGDNEMS